MVQLKKAFLLSVCGNALDPSCIHFLDHVSLSWVLFCACVLSPSFDFRCSSRSL